MFWKKKVTPEAHSLEAHNPEAHNPEAHTPEAHHAPRVAMAQSAAQTLIADSYTFKGKIHGQGPVELQGRIEGHLDIRGRVCIDNNAVIQGDIKAEVLEIGGAVEGHLDITRQLTLGPTARFEGSAAAGRIDMAEGALLNGDVQMKA